MNEKRRADKGGAIPGGAFLIEPIGSHGILMPEDFDEEMLAIGKTASDFMANEVVPREREIDSKEGKGAGLAVKLLKQAAELGLCMADIPEEHGGLELGVTASMLITEKFGDEGSFAVTWGAHTGIGTLPIVYFGTEAQKAKYLPASATTERVHAYCLTEPGSGSDALAARTKAVLNEAGTHYVLNGTKMWITNGGWADVYIIFAKVDGEHFTGFIVERDYPGVSPGAEEHKLGLRGSSTTTVNLDNVEVPVENVLGEVGKGHKIAFHILNVGRFKLGASSAGHIKHVINLALAYGMERKQFGTRIIDFGALRQKIADMATLAWVTETLSWRLAGYMEEVAHGKGDAPKGDKLRSAIEEYAIESSIAKVFGTEAVAWAIDEALQIHGGMGFSEEYAIEKSYRDNRVNRIFEGTNEINRLLIPGQLLKRAMKGQIALMPAVGKLIKELDTGEYAFPAGASLLDGAIHAAELTKKLTLLAYSAATQRYMMKIDKEQQVLMLLADLTMQAYAADSACIRAKLLVDDGRLDAAATQVQAAVLFAADALDKARGWARQVILAAYEGDKAASWLAKLAKLDHSFNVNRVALRRAIAEDVVSHEKYTLSSY